MRKGEPKWEWRRYLTPEEREIIEQGDRLMEEVARVNRDRPRIINRCTQRAMYAARAE